MLTEATAPGRTTQARQIEEKINQKNREESYTNQTFNFMKMQTRQKSYRIARRAGYQGARPSGSIQPEVEELVTGSTSSPDLDGHQNRENPTSGPPGSPTSSRNRRKTKYSRRRL